MRKKQKSILAVLLSAVIAFAPATELAAVDYSVEESEQAAEFVLESAEVEESNLQIESKEEVQENNTSEKISEEPSEEEGIETESSLEQETENESSKPENSEEQSSELQSTESGTTTETETESFKEEGSKEESSETTEIESSGSETTETENSEESPETTESDTEDASASEELSVPEETTEEGITEEETITEEESTLEETTTEEETATEEFTRFTAEAYLEYMPGMPEDYTLSAQEISEKKSLAAYGDFWEMQEGVDYVAGEVLVIEQNLSKLNDVAHAYAAEIDQETKYFAVLKLDEGISVADAVAVATGDNNMPAVWPNYYRTIHAFEENDTQTEILSYNDPLLDKTNDNYQWQHSNIGSEIAWNAGYTGQGVKVGIIDTGINSQHEDFSGKIANSFNAVGGSPDFETTDVTDNQGHGTHVAGIVAAAANNGRYGCGVAPEAELYILKVSDGRTMTDDDILRAIQKSLEWKLDVVNMSLGGPGETKVYDKPFNDGLRQGTLFFVSAGNESSNIKNIPASNSQVICIAATDQNNQRASFSTFGSWVDFSAPGVDIPSTSKDGGMVLMSGTSMACPVATGEAAVLLSANRDILNDRSSARKEKLVKALKKGAVSAGSNMGAGIINLPKALGINNAAQTPNVPEFSVKAGTYNEASKTIELSSKNVNGCRIYYTLNGKAPTYKNGQLSAETFLYEGPVTLEGKAKITVKAIAVSTSGICSKTASATYQFKPKVSSIQITGITNTIAPGGTVALTANIEPEYAANKQVSWSISPVNQGVSISSKGKVTAKSNAAAGTYTITATAKENSSVTSTYTVSVSDSIDPISKVSFGTKKYTKLIKDQDVSIALGADLNAAKASGGTAGAADFDWSVNNTKLANVDANGTVMLYALPETAGTVKVTAVSKDGKNKKATVSIVVKRAVKQMVMKDAMVAPGKSLSVTPVFTPAKPASKKVTYEVTMANGSESDGKISISSSGKVSAKKDAVPGTKYLVKATTTDEFKTSQSCTITISKAVISSIKFSEKKYTIYRVALSKNTGSSDKTKLTLNVDVKLSNGSSAEKGTYIFSSSNPGVATVDSEGIVTATGQASGTTKITCMATDGSGKKATCSITVANPVSRITISPAAGSEGYVACGKSIKLTANLESDYGKVDTKNVKWTSSRTDVTVSKGVVRASSSAAAGNTVITASTNDGALSARYVVQVTKHPGKYKLDGSYLQNGFLLLDASKGDFYDMNQAVQIAPDVTITSSNPSVISVASTKVLVGGKVRVAAALYPYKKGTATITVKANDGSGAKASFTIRVR